MAVCAPCDLALPCHHNLSRLQCRRDTGDSEQAGTGAKQEGILIGLLSSCPDRAGGTQHNAQGNLMRFYSESAEPSYCPLAASSSKKNAETAVETGCDCSADSGLTGCGVVTDIIDTLRRRLQ